jgi:hypothetical protein
MTRLGNFSNETLAVDAVSADINPLEKPAARCGTLSEGDMKLLARCNARLSHLIPLLAANNAGANIAAAGTCASPARKRPPKLKKGRRSLMKFHVNSP